MANDVETDFKKVVKELDWVQDRFTRMTPKLFSLKRAWQVFNTQGVDIDHCSVHSPIH